MPNAPISLRPATQADVPVVLALIKELSVYEKLEHVVEATEERLHAALFGHKPCAEAVVAWDEDAAVGMAVFFTNFSTFLSLPGIYLEDLYVQPQARGKGIGKALLLYLARLAKQRGCGRLEWTVLDWNEPAIGFYKKIGAEPMDGWTIFRLTGDALTRAASSADTGSETPPEAI